MHFCFICENKIQKIMKQVYLLIIALLFSVPIWADDITIPLYDISKGGTDAADQIAGSKDKRSLSFAPEASHDGRQSQVCADLIPPTGMGNFFAAHRFRKNQTKVLHV